MPCYPFLMDFPIIVAFLYLVYNYERVAFGKGGVSLNKVVFAILHVPFFITFSLFFIIAGPVLYVYKYFQK